MLSVEDEGVGEVKAQRGMWMCLNTRTFSTEEKIIRDVHLLTATHSNIDGTVETNYSDHVTPYKRSVSR